MTSIGETLRRERVRRNLDLDKISQELKISSRLLEAIEAERFEKLPGGVFAKSFIRQYARVLGLDDEEFAADLDRILRPETEAPQRAEHPQTTSSSIPLPRVEEWQSVGNNRNWPSFLPSAVLVVVVMLLCSAVYAFWQRTHRQMAAHVDNPPAAQAVQPSPGPPVAPAQTAAAQPVPSQPAPASVPAPAPPDGTAPVASADRPATDATTAESASAAAAPPLEPVGRQPAGPAGPVHVEFTTDERVWVLARADGKYLFSGTLEARESRTVDANEAVLLRLGNAGGVTVTLNGKPVGALGPKGQVRTVQFTSGGFQIVAAPKSPAPLDPL